LKAGAIPEAADGKTSLDVAKNPERARQLRMARSNIGVK